MAYEKQNFTSGQILTAAALNHMEDGIANAGGASSWNDLKDKPFGATTEMVEIVSEQSATTVDEYGDGFGSALLSVMPQNIVADKEYKVVYDGVDYICKAFEEHEGWVYLGGVYTEEEDEYNFNGYPFILEILYSDEETYLLTTETGIHTIAIYEEQEVVKKLDPKFSGTITLYTVNWDNEYIFKDKDGKEKLTQAELLSIVNSGANIVFIYIDVDKPLWYSNHVYITISSLTGEVDFNVVRGNGNMNKYYTAEQSGGPQ